MSRRVVALDEFEVSLQDLGSHGAARLVHALARHIAGNPERAPSLDGMNVRVLKTKSYGDHPALRLFYTFDAHAVYLLHVERYDELSP